jgi:hypothetical protein
MRQSEFTDANIADEEISVYGEGTLIVVIKLHMSCNILCSPGWISRFTHR